MLANTPVCQRGSEYVKQDLVNGTETNVIISLFIPFIFIGPCRECVFIRKLCVCTYCRPRLISLAELCGMQISSSGRYKSHRLNGFFCGPKGIYKLIAKVPCDTLVKQVSNLPKVTQLLNAELEKTPIPRSLPIAPNLASVISLPGSHINRRATRMVPVATGRRKCIVREVVCNPLPTSTEG